MIKFWAVFGSIIFCLAVAATTLLVILSKQTIDIDFEFAAIEDIKLYNNSTIGTEQTTADFEEIKNSLNSSMHVKKIDTIGKSVYVCESVEILKDEKFSSAILSNNRCVELVFKEQQSKIVKYGNDSKKINYDRLLIVLNGSNNLSSHKVFYASGESAFENDPMQIAFNETVLQKLF